MRDTDSISARDISETKPLEVLAYGQPEMNRGWPLWGCTVFLGVSALLQITFLPCLCGDSAQKMQFAGALDGLFIIRCAVAIFFRELGFGWIIYGGMLLSSAFWIEPVLLSETTRWFYGLVGIHSFGR